MLTVTTLNVNGLRSAERRGFREWVARARPDVLCLQEVRCDEDAMRATPGLHEVWHPEGWAARWNPAVQKGYAGTAVWARQGLGEAIFTTGCGHARGDEEGRAVGVTVGGIDVWSLYLPSGSSGPERQEWKFSFMDHIRPWFDRLLASGHIEREAGLSDHAPVTVQVAVAATTEPGA